MKAFHLLVALAALTTAAPRVTQPVPDGDIPPPPAELTPAPSTSVHCHHKYCDGQTSWCFYWGGITSFDVSLGPLPGETRTSLGLCTSSGTPTSAESQVTPP